MRNSILCLSLLALAAPSFAGDARFTVTKDGSGYERSLREAGVPVSGGMVWRTAGQSGLPAVATSVVVVREAVKAETATATALLQKGLRPSGT